MGLCIVYIDQITIWDENTYSLVNEHQLAYDDFDITDAIFDGKGRRIALKGDSGIRIIDIYKQQELWRLNFNSIKNINSNEYKNSQFLITMNSEDNSEEPTDALLVFNFNSRRPLKVLKFSQNDPITSADYISLPSLESPSICCITQK